MKAWKGFCILAAVTLSISGCGSSKKTAIPANSYTPTLEVSTIVNGDAATLRITTDLSKEYSDQQRKQGEGHVHVSLDKGEKEMMMTD